VNLGTLFIRVQEQQSNSGPWITDHAEHPEIVWGTERDMEEKLLSFANYLRRLYVKELY